MPKGLQFIPAVKVSLLIALASIFLSFLPQWQLQTILENEPNFWYALLVHIGGTFFSSLLSLLGLSRFLK